jgi:putative FmdB family regulatory protein
MPTYEYACSKCGEHLEVVQSFKDDPLERCPACRGRLRKVFSPVGIVFKGSGFYKTDSRDSKKAKSGSAATDKGTSDTESSSPKAESSSDSTASKTKESTTTSKDKAPAKKESTKSGSTPAAAG